MDDCKRFSPTKAVNHSQFKFNFTARIKLINTNEPANARIILSFIIVVLGNGLALIKNKPGGFVINCIYVFQSYNRGEVLLLVLE